MFGFGSSSSSSSGSPSEGQAVRSSGSKLHTMAQKKEAIMQHIKNETAMTNAQELMNNSAERCFKSCVVNPGSSLTSNEQACMSSCFDKYLEAFTVVSRAYSSRIRTEYNSTPKSEFTSTSESELF